MKRIGIYSGTFDPVHIGHVGFAVRAMEEAGLDQVVFLPEKTPRDKDNVTDLKHRFELLVCATAPYDGLSVRLLNAAQFCVRSTLPEIREMFDDADLHLLIGSDVVNTFSDRWPNLDELFSQMKLIVGLRIGDSRRDIRRRFRKLDVQAKPRAIFVDSPMPVSSSTRIRDGEVERDITPEAIAYIKKYNLYQKDRR